MLFIVCYLSVCHALLISDSEWVGLHSNSFLHCHFPFQDFEFDVEAASLLRLTCYNSRGRLLGDEFNGKVVIDVSLHLKLQSNFQNPRISSTMNLFLRCRYPCSNSSASRGAISRSILMLQLPNRLLPFFALRKDFVSRLQDLTLSCIVF